MIFILLYVGDVTNKLLSKEAFGGESFCQKKLLGKAFANKTLKGLYKSI
jgi:hypothetical protein